MRQLLLNYVFDFLIDYQYLIKYCLYPLRWCVKFLFVLTEWKFPSQYVIDNIAKTEKAIIIYPHTTYFDFVMMWLYIIAYPELGRDLYCVVNEGIYYQYPKIFEHLHCFPATAKEKNDGGFVESTVKKFKNYSKCKILISPEGSLKPCKWRSGYYYLAKELGYPIMVVGTNYATHKLEYRGTHKLTESYQNLELKLQEYISYITPLYPECSYVAIKKPHNPPSVVGLLTLTAILCPIPTLYYTFKISWICGIIFTLGNLCSMIYHYYGELCFRKTEPIIIKSTIAIYFIFLIIRELIVIDIWSVSLWLGVYIFYNLGAGRKLHDCRSYDYHIYHVWFHIFGGFATLYFLV